MVGFSTQMRTLIICRGPCGRPLILVGAPPLSLRETASSLWNQSFLALGKGTANSTQVWTLAGHLGKKSILFPS